MTTQSQMFSDPEGAAALRQREIANVLARQALGNDGPMIHPLQVVGKAAQSAIAALLSNKADAAQDTYGQNVNAEMSRILGGGAPPAAQPPAAPPDALTSAVSGVPMQAPAQPPQGGGQFAPIIQQAAQRTGVPADLLQAQIRQESGGNPNAVGKAGEIGLGQIMPSTARAPGFGVRPVDPAKLTDPATNINFQADYMAGRGRAAGVQDWTDPAQRARGLAGYNGGGDPQYAANVSRYLPQGGGPAPAPQQMAQAASPQTDYMARAVEAARSPYPQVRAQAAMLAQLAQAQAASGGRDARLTFDQQKHAEDMAFRQREAAQRAGESAADRDLRVRLQQQDISVRRELHDPRMEQVVGQDGQPTLVPARQAAGAPAYIPSQQPVTPERAQQDINRATASKPQNTVINQGENAFAKSLAGVTTEGIKERQAAAITGRDGIESANRIDELLAAGANTGTGANWRTGFERALATAGLIDGKNVSNTEQLMANMARSLLPLAANMKGILSDKDLAFLQSANGMSVGATPETIKRMADLQRQIGTRAIEQWNPLAEAIGREGGSTEAARVLFSPVQAPNPAARGMPGGPPADAAPAPMPMPQPGAVVGNFRFRGGNPRDRNAWEAVQ
jgi:soluble lytic murein transglycosylase-like protein